MSHNECWLGGVVRIFNSRSWRSSLSPAPLLRAAVDASPHLVSFPLVLTFMKSFGCDKSVIILRLYGPALVQKTREETS